MSGTDQNLNFIKSPPKPLKQKSNNLNTKNANNNLSSPSDESLKEVPSHRKIKIEYERVGSFEVFETTCPLEYFKMPMADPMYFSETFNKENERPSKGGSHKNKSLKSGKSKRNIKTINIMENMSSESEDELTAAFNLRMKLAEEKKPLSIPITLDAFYRSENPTSSDPLAGDALVYWAKGDCPSISNGQFATDDESESELDADIEKYIHCQQEKQRLGENVSGEMLWYDQDRSIIRNLHNEGSISLTSYGDTDEKIFGKTEVFDEILTCEERAMLRARNTDEAYVKVEKKKALKNKKGATNKQQWARPKDQGDWL